MEEFPQEKKKLIVARNVEETWDLKRILEKVNQELGAHEACRSKTAEDGKNGSNNYEGFPYIGSSLHINSQYRNRGQKLLILSVYVL